MTESAHSNPIRTRMSSSGMATHSAYTRWRTKYSLTVPWYLIVRIRRKDLHQTFSWGNRPLRRRHEDLLLCGHNGRCSDGGHCSVRTGDPHQEGQGIHRLQRNNGKDGWAHSGWEDCRHWQEAGALLGSPVNRSE